MVRSRVSMVRSRVSAVRGAAVLGAAVALLVPLGVPAASGAPGVPAKPAIWDDGTWLLRSSLTSGPATSTFAYGRGSGEFPVMGDWDGDGTETVGVARWDQTTDTFIWYLRDANSGGPATVTPFEFGTVAFVAVDQLGTIPVVGDWDGDGVDTVGVVYYDESTSGGIRWELRNSNTAGSPDTTFTYSNGRDIPVVGDWNGDGTDSPGVFRQQNRWLLRNTNSGGNANLSFLYGSGRSDIIELPVVGDWDGNGTDTAGLLRNEPATQQDGGFARWLVRDSNTSGGATRSILYGNNSFFIGLPVDFIPRLAFH